MTNDKRAKLSGMLGLAMRAGKVTLGTEQICAVLPKGRARLVLVSSSASENTKKKLRFKCVYYETRMIEVNIDTEELGRLLGKTYTPAAVAITDDNFASAIANIISSDESL